jgi:hypothetical protein
LIPAINSLLGFDLRQDIRFAGIDQEQSRRSPMGKDAILPGQVGNLPHDREFFAAKNLPPRETVYSFMTAGDRVGEAPLRIALAKSLDFGGLGAIQ